MEVLKWVRARARAMEDSEGTRVRWWRTVTKTATRRRRTNGWWREVCVLAIDERKVCVWGRPFSWRTVEVCVVDLQLDSVFFFSKLESVFFFFSDHYRNRKRLLRDLISHNNRTLLFMISSLNFVIYIPYPTYYIRALLELKKREDENLNV